MTNTFQAGRASSQGPCPGEHRSGMQRRPLAEKFVGYSQNESGQCPLQRRAVQVSHCSSFEAKQTKSQHSTHHYNDSRRAMLPVNGSAMLREKFGPRCLERCCSTTATHSCATHCAPSSLLRPDGYESEPCASSSAFARFTSSDRSGKVDGERSVRFAPVDAPLEAGTALQSAAFGDERSVRAPLALDAPPYGSDVLSETARNGCEQMAIDAGRDRALSEQQVRIEHLPLGLCPASLRAGPAR